MAAINFPNAPVLNEKFPTAPVPGMPTYTWDGEKWTTITGGTISSPAGIVLPSLITPLMDGVAAIGSDPSYALGDHVHPRDTSKADVTYVNSQDLLLQTNKADLTYVNSANAIQDTQINTHTTQIATKIGEAPNDGQQYARKSLAWAVVAGTGGGGITEAPIDTKYYARKDAAWAEIVGGTGPTGPTGPAGPASTVIYVGSFF